MLRIVFSLVLFPCLLWAQESEHGKLQLFQFLVGSWEGTASSNRSAGNGEREFSVILKGKFVHIRNRIEFDSPDTDSSIGVREDWGILNVDDNSGVMMLRQFGDDGSVTRYVADSVYGAEDIVVRFTAESSDNAPDGAWARLTITIHGEDSFSELLERGLAAGVVQERLESHWARKK